MIAKNAEETIGECLESLRAFSEVVVYLNDSVDSTREIAQSYSNVKLINGDFSGFGPTKNSAASYASNDWILSLDSDEILLPQVLAEIEALKLENEHEVFVLRRVNYCLGKEIKYSGWSNDYLVRIYNKNRHQFNQNLVHEFILLHNDSVKVSLKHPFKHHAIQNINQFLQKMNQYSTIYATDNYHKKYSSPLVAVIKALFHFIKAYILKFGFMDGYRGLLISISGANGVFYKYMKLYEENKR